MKSAITYGLGLAIVLLGFLGGTPTAHAVVATNHSGTICKNYDAADATLIDYLTNGTRSFKTGATNIICPLTRNTSNTMGAFLSVAVMHSGTQTTTCTAFSHNNNGTLLGSQGQTKTGSGVQQFGLGLLGSNKSTTSSNYSVLCTIPGNGYGVVLNINVQEQ
jgi:hypothetical protein